MTDTSPQSFDRPEDMAAFVASLDAPIAIVGAGTKAGIGFPVDAPRLSTAGLSGITYFEPKEFIMGALAGTPLLVLEEALAEHDLILPFDPPRFGGDPTFGGVMATNIGGAERESMGAPRDNLLGAQYINGKGELLKAGGRVVKNVSGYDVPRGLCGSWGTLAVLTELTIKVLPKARAIEVDKTALERVLQSPFVWRVSMPRDQSAALVESWGGTHSSQWDGALLWLGSDAQADVHAMAAKAGGHALLMQSPSAYRTDNGCFQPLDDGNTTLHRLLKQAFDPKGFLNPGRMHKGL